MAFSTESRSVVVDMNVTPMIDVLLVLLISYFLFNLPMRYVPVMVPPPQAPGGGGAQLVLELPDGGGFTLNRQPVPDAVLDAVLRNAFEIRPVKLLFVDAGGERSYAEVIDAMERARLAGVQVVAFMPK